MSDYDYDVLRRFVSKCAKYKNPEDLTKVLYELIWEAKYEILMEQKLNGNGGVTDG